MKNTSFSKIMKHPQKSLEAIDNLSIIMDQYDVFIIDLWGVIHNGKTPFPSSLETVKKLQDANKKIIFLTNMPRPKRLVFETLTGYGLEPKYDVVTSGDCTELYLSKFYATSKIYHLGESINQEIARGFTFTEVLDDAEVVLLSLFTESYDEAQTYAPFCKQIAEKGIPVICANPDKQAAHGNNTRYTAGFFANMIEDFAGTVHYIGKPFVSVYDYVFNTFSVKPDQCIMIGDTLETDILGASNVGIDSVLVLTGVTQQSLQEKNITLRDYIYTENLPEPTYVLQGL